VTKPGPAARCSGVTTPALSLLWLVTVLAAAVIQACSVVVNGIEGSGRGGCSTDNDCPSSMACALSVCKGVCGSNSDCPPGQLCAAVSSGSPATVCVVIDVDSPGDGGQTDATGQMDAAIAADAGSAADAGIDATLDAAFDQADGTSGDDGSASDGMVSSTDGDSGDDGGVGPDALGPCGTPLPVCPDGGCAPELVLFGGVDLNGYRSDTWVWDGSQWTERSVDAGPSPRGYAGATTGCGGVMLYGGKVSAPENFSSEQWVWVNDAWYQVPESDSGPGGRSDFAFARVTSTQTVLFGGWTNESATTQDTLIWDDTTGWVEPHPPNSPQGRNDSAFGVVGGSFALFGGAKLVGGLQSPLGDTWVWDGDEWSEHYLSSISPGPRHSAASASVNLNGTDLLVVFGGYGPIGDGGSMTLGETWVWDGLTWTMESPEHSPDARTHASAASLGASVVLFGGYDVLGSLLDNATWTWDGTDWTKHSVSGPPERAGASMAATPQ